MGPRLASRGGPSRSRWRSPSPRSLNGATARERGGTRRAAPRALRAGGRFNGATAREPWRTRSYWPLRSATWKLQWGHGSRAVEDSGAVYKGVPMALLQWGHGSRAVEDL